MYRRTYGLEHRKKISADELEVELRTEAVVSEILAPMFRDIADRIQSVKNEGIVAFLEGEKWYPMVKVTNAEYRASKVLNKVLDDLIRKSGGQTKADRKFMNFMVAFSVVLVLIAFILLAIRPDTETYDAVPELPSATS